MKNVRERLKYILQEKGISEGEFETQAGLSRGYVSKVGDSIRKASKEKISKFLPELNINWLITGEGSIYNDDKATPIAPYIRENLVYLDYVSINVMASFVETLYGGYVELEKFGVVPEEDEILNADNVIFQVDGNSMIPTISNGAKILAKKIDSSKWESASGVVVIVYGKTLTVKRILKNCLFNENKLILKADNPTYGQMEVQLSEIRGMWQAIKIVNQKIL